MEIKNIGRCIFEGIGEAPHYDAASDELYFVDFPNLEKGQHGRIFRRKYGDSSMHTEAYDVGNRLSSFVIPTKSGSFLVGSGLDILEVDWPKDGKQASHSVMISVDHGKMNRINDGKCDPRGRLVAGTMSLEKAPAVVYAEESGSIYGLDTDRSLHVLDTKYTLSNGLAWTHDQSRFFFIDSIMNKVFAYDYDPDAFTAKNKTILFDLPAHSELEGNLADGCCMDSNNRLWVCCFFGSKVMCIDTVTGQKVTEIKMPTLSPTSCCFAGPSLNELVVTSSKTAIPDSDAEAGSLYRVVNVGATGYGSVRYEG